MDKSVNPRDVANMIATVALMIFALAISGGWDAAPAHQQVAVVALVTE